MVPIPDEADEDARRSIRERTELISERVGLSNRIGAVLATIAGAQFPEDLDGFEDSDGCPDTDPIEVEERAFVITGTQTGGAACVGLDDFCQVESYDYRENRVVSHGLTAPSSESLTHGAIYDLSPTIRCVMHGHSPTIWSRSPAALSSAVSVSCRYP